MRIAQIALVAAVVIVGLLGYTEPGHRILNAIGLPNACKHGCSYASSVGGLFHLVLSDIAMRGAGNNSKP
jgi:hypothetical protein